MNEQEAIKDIETRTNKYQIANDLEFNKNKKNINFILRGKNKYYYANQCAVFTKNLLLYGYQNISKDQIKKDGVCFNEYSINNGYNQYCRDIKRFNNKTEMLGFVIGYNEAIDDHTRFTYNLATHK
tara:strand:+ start:74 stop:451 length:378 start_codon:yes stop_codon:yes gene_type:complete